MDRERAGSRAVVGAADAVRDGGHVGHGGSNPCTVARRGVTGAVPIFALPHRAASQRERQPPLPVERELFKQHGQQVRALGGVGERQRSDSLSGLAARAGVDERRIDARHGAVAGSAAAGKAVRVAQQAGAVLDAPAAVLVILVLADEHLIHTLHEVSETFCRP